MPGTMGSEEGDIAAKRRRKTYMYPRMVTAPHTSMSSSTSKVPFMVSLPKILTFFLFFLRGFMSEPQKPSSRCGWSLKQKEVVCLTGSGRLR